MSYIPCDWCSWPINTDDDPEALIEIIEAGKPKTVPTCEKCREEMEMEEENDEQRARYEVEGKEDA